MTGRPSTFTDELAAEICERIAMDESLVKICESENMPSTNTVYRWLHEKPEFRDNYVRARGDQAHTVADQAKKVRDDLLAGLIDHQTANALLNFIKWETGKRNPKTYGDKIAHVGGDPASGDNPIQTESRIDMSALTDEQARLIASLPIKNG